MHPDRLEGDGLKVGANPFSHPDYADVFHSKTLEDEYFGTFVPRQLSETAKIAIQEYYLRLVDDRQNRQASYLAEKNNNLDKHVRNFARQLFPGLKELVLVRDPRDLVCSQVAYFTRDPKEVIKEVSFALKELTRLKREEANKVLFVRYEDLVLDSLSALRRILGYLKIEPTYSISDEGERASFKSHATSDSPSGSIGRWKSQSLLNERTWSTLKWDEFLDEFGYLEHGH